MKQYHDMLEKIRFEGVDKGDRTGTGTRSIFGHQMRFDLKAGFPLLTTKFTPFRLILTELLWFLQGNPNISYLHEHNNHIWDEWVKEDGTFGPIYGSQWRSWPNPVITYDDANGEHIRDEPIDQIANVINQLITNPNDRRMIVSAWNVADVEAGKMALPPCHVLFQFYTRPLLTGGLGLSCQLYQRSCDTFLGVPFNIASYALLTHMIAELVGMRADEFIWTGGDVHIYKNHFPQVDKLLTHNPELCALPNLKFTRQVNNIDEFTVGDFELQGYTSYPPLKADISV